MRVAVRERICGGRPRPAALVPPSLLTASSPSCAVTFLHRQKSRVLAKAAAEGASQPSDDDAATSGDFSELLSRISALREAEGTAAHAFEHNLRAGRHAPTRHFASLGSAVRCLVCEGGVLVVGTDDGRVHVLDATTGATLRVLTGLGGPITAVDFDGAHVLACAKHGDDGNIGVWPAVLAHQNDLNTLVRLETDRDLRRSSIVGAAFWRGDAALAAAELEADTSTETDGTARPTWNGPGGTGRRERPFPALGITAAFPGGYLYNWCTRWMGVDGGDRPAPSGRAKVPMLPGSLLRSRITAFARGNQYVAAGLADGRALFWPGDNPRWRGPPPDLKPTEAPSFQFRAHGGPITALALGSDGAGRDARLATGAGDGAIVLWDLVHGRPLARWPGPGSAVASLQILAGAHGRDVVCALYADGSLAAWTPDSPGPGVATGVPPPRFRGGPLCVLEGPHRDSGRTPNRGGGHPAAGQVTTAVFSGCSLYTGTAAGWVACRDFGLPPSEGANRPEP